MIRSTTRITALKRLLSATSDFGGSVHVMEKQTERTQSRLSQGVDLGGQTFAPYKDRKRKHLNSRPLEHAARLFESPKYDLSRNLEGATMKMTITGMAARIARYQNFRRRFVGFARSDRPEVKREIFTMIADAYNKWTHR